MVLQFERFPVTAFAQQCTLLWDDITHEAVLVDVGGDAQKLLKEVDKRALKLTAIWLTHGHVDHVSGVAPLQRAGHPVLGPHEDDDFWIQALPQIAQQYGFPKAEVFTPQKWLHEGDALTVGEWTFQVLHIPGHTPGHVVFYCEAAKLLIAGDVIFLESIGRTDFPRGNHAQLIDHIKRKILTLPPQTRILPGHGPITEVGHEIKHNPYLQGA